MIVEKNATHALLDDMDCAFDGTVVIDEILDFNHKTLFIGSFIIICTSDLVMKKFIRDYTHQS